MKQEYINMCNKLVAFYENKEGHEFDEIESKLLFEMEYIINLDSFTKYFGMFVYNGNYPPLTEKALIELTEKKQSKLGIILHHPTTKILGVIFAFLVATAIGILGFIL
jgi:hypothetical protein